MADQKKAHRDLDTVCKVKEGKCQLVFISPESLLGSNTAELGA